MKHLFLLKLFSVAALLFLNFSYANEIESKVDYLFLKFQELRGKGERNLDIQTAFFELKSLCDSSFISNECASFVFDEKNLIIKIK